MKAKHLLRRPVSTIILFTSLALLGLLCFSLADAGPAAGCAVAAVATDSSSAPAAVAAWRPPGRRFDVFMVGIPERACGGSTILRRIGARAQFPGSASLLP